MCTRNVILALLVVFGTVGGASALEAVDVNTRIADVVNNPAFGDWGRLLFPASKCYYSGGTLGDLRLTWYGRLSPSRTVSIITCMLRETEAGRQVFYPIYPHDDPRAGIPGCSSFVANEAGNSRSATPEEASCLSGQCMTVSPTQWSWHGWAITPSR